MSQSRCELINYPISLPCTVFAYNDQRIERAYRLIRNVWERISKPDQARLLGAISTWSETRVNLYLKDNWEHIIGTSAFITFTGESAYIVIDSGYFDAADDDHVMTTLAHELGHLLGFLDDDSSEETAGRYQFSWGFSDGWVAYKDEACRYMDNVLRKEGIPGGLFWGLDGQNYYYLRGGARLTLRSADVYLTCDQPWATLKGLLLRYWPDELPEIAARETLADELEGTERFAQYGEELTKITMECLPEDMW